MWEAGNVWYVYSRLRESVRKHDFYNEWYMSCIKCIIRIGVRLKFHISIYMNKERGKQLALWWSKISFITLHANILMHILYYLKIYCIQRCPKIGKKTQPTHQNPPWSHTCIEEINSYSDLVVTYVLILPIIIDIERYGTLWRHISIRIHTRWM